MRSEPSLAKIVADISPGKVLSQSETEILCTVMFQSRPGYHLHCQIWFAAMDHASRSSIASAACGAQDVRSSPERGHSCWNPLCAKSRYCAVSFDQLVGEPEQLRWDCDAECFSRFEIDDERKLTRLFDR
jgi:hypothetical protein